MCNFLDQSCTSRGGANIDPEDFEPLRKVMRKLATKVKAKFKEREMFPLLRDMWFYSETQTAGVVPLLFRGKGMLSRRRWPVEMSTVSIQTYNNLRKKLDVDIHQVW